MKKSTTAGEQKLAGHIRDRKSGTLRDQKVPPAAQKDGKFNSSHHQQQQSSSGGGSFGGAPLEKAKRKEKKDRDPNAVVREGYRRPEDKWEYIFFKNKQNRL